MDMISRETVDPNLHSESWAPPPHQRNVGPKILLFKKGPLASVAPLGDVMGNTRSHNSRKPYHQSRLHLPGRASKGIKYGVPRIPAEFPGRRSPGLQNLSKGHEVRFCSPSQPPVIDQSKVVSCVFYWPTLLQDHCAFFSGFRLLRSDFEQFCCS